MNSPMQPDLDALAALAEAATPGPWYADTENQIRVEETGSPVTIWPRSEDAAFIAACDPATVLALVERVREAEAENVARIEMAEHHARLDEGERKDFDARYDRLRARAEAAERRVAELEAELGDMQSQGMKEARQTVQAARADLERERADAAEKRADMEREAYSHLFKHHPAIAERDRLRAALREQRDCSVCPPTPCSRGHVKVISDALLNPPTTEGSEPC